MNGFLRWWFIPRLSVLCLIASPVSFAAGSWAEMYPPTTLAQQKSRLESRVGQLYSLLRPYLSAPERSALGNLVLEFPLGDPNRDPFAFYAHRIDNQLIVTMSVASLLWVEDLCTAYAWLHTNGYSLETIDEYVTMLRQKRAADFPGGRYPPPRTALRVPSDALRDPAVSELSLRLRNSTYAFILTHELGHIVLGHRGYAGISMAEARRHEADADRFALDVLLRVSEIPVGAVLFFQAQAYMMPNPGLFKAEGKTMQACEAAVLKEMTHPLTADRLQALALGLDRAASREPRGAERETLQFVATRLANIAEVLQDADLQQCMAVAAQRTDPAELAPRRPGNTAGFLKKCTKPRWPTWTQRPRGRGASATSRMGGLSMNSGPTVAIGSTGPDVRRLQRILVMVKSLDYAGIDGVFGAQTDLAVKSFQQGNGLTADGIVGPLTWQRLPADPNTPQLALGAKGGVVSALQQALLRYGGPGSATDPGPIDGDFGPRTQSAVRAYQSQRGVTADGTVGDQTWWVPAGAAGATLASLAGLVTI